MYDFELRIRNIGSDVGCPVKSNTKFLSCRWIEQTIVGLSDCVFLWNIIFVWSQVPFSKHFNRWSFSEMNRWEIGVCFLHSKRNCGVAMNTPETRQLDKMAGNIFWLHCFSTFHCLCGACEGWTYWREEIMNNNNNPDSIKIVYIVGYTYIRGMDMIFIFPQ